MVITDKVSDVAKDFGKSNKEIIELLDKYCGGPAKKASTVLEENELNILFDKITIQNSVKNFDAYFKSGTAKTKPENAAPKKQDKPAKKAETAKDKKRESQAAILQMAEQAAKRAEEKAKKKADTMEYLPFHLVVESFAFQNLWCHLFNALNSCDGLFGSAEEKVVGSSSSRCQFFKGRFEFRVLF